MKALEIVSRRVSTSANRFGRTRFERHRAAKQVDQERAAGLSWQAADQWMEALSSAMLDNTQAPGVLGRAVVWQLGGDAKRVRARLALAAGHALGAEMQEVVKVAAAVELLHEASLVHDDLQDRDTLRRGRNAVWVEFGDELAVTLGDWLINQAYDVILQVEAPAHTTRALARAMAKAVAETVRGQAVENEAKTCLDTNLTDYIDMATGKTAPLLAFPLEAVCMLAGRSQQECAAIRSGLECLGGAYQLRDDLIDLLGQKGRGSAGADLVEGKATLPVLIYHGAADAHEQESLKAFLQSPREERARQAKRWARILVESEAFDEVRDTVDGLVTMGFHALDEAPTVVALLVKRVFGKIIAPVQRERILSEAPIQQAVAG